MKIKSILLLLCLLLDLVLLVSSTAQVQTSKDEKNAEKDLEEDHVNQEYGGGGDDDGWGGGGGRYGGGGWGGGPGGGWNGGRGGWGGGGRRRWGCRFGCCGAWYRHGGCSRCCRSLAEAMAFNENTTP